MSIPHKGIEGSNPSVSAILLRAGALRRIGNALCTKQDGLRSFSEGGLPRRIASLEDIIQDHRTHRDSLRPRKFAILAPIRHKGDVACSMPSWPTTSKR